MLKVTTAALTTRPNRVYETGTWFPYPVQRGPANIARGTIAEFRNLTAKPVPKISTVPGVGFAKRTIEAFLRFIRPMGPLTKPEMEPEELAMLAQRVSAAMAAGKRFPKTIDPRVVQAAKYLLAGKPFVITSAGRSVTVNPAR